MVFHPSRNELPGKGKNEACLAQLPAANEKAVSFTSCSEKEITINCGAKHNKGVVIDVVSNPDFWACISIWPR